MAPDRQALVPHMVRLSCIYFRKISNISDRMMTQKFSFCYTPTTKCLCGRSRGTVLKLLCCPPAS